MSRPSLKILLVRRLHDFNIHKGLGFDYMVNILERMETGRGWWETTVVSIFYDLIY